MLVYGDTNSLLVLSAAAKLHIPIVHVEAGLRSFNKRMPEEINRILTDHVSTLLFCPTATAVSNLELEGLTDCVFNVGDVMCDVASVFQGEAARSEGIINRLELNGKRFAPATCHRAEKYR